MKVIAVVMVLCCGGLLAWQSAPSPGERATHDRAVKLFNAMQTYSGSTAWDQAREARRYGNVRIVVARDSAGGREIVLAVRAIHRPGNTADWFPEEPYDVTRCFRWTDDVAWGTADEVGCPETTDVDRTSATADPIPAGADAAVARALRTRQGVEDVAAALSHLDAQVARVDGGVAVAVAGIEGYDSGRQVNDCLLGFARRGRVEVWRPSDIQVAPGEASCDPEAALAPYLQRPPH